MHASPQRNKNNYIPNENQIHEISILKQENERLKQQLEKFMATDNTFEQYKKLKEEEIKFLKFQIEELLKNQKKLEENISLKNKENDELKLQIQQLMKNINNLKQTPLIFHQQKQQNSLESMKNQILTNQDAHLEIVKGDIIKSSEELELLTRKICKNHKKIVLDL